MDITGQLTPTGADVFYDPKFRHVLEDHLEVLKTDERNDTIQVSPREGEKFKRDLFGFLKVKDVQPQHYWIVMRVNGMRSPIEFVGYNSLTVPTESAIRTVKQMYESTS